MIFDYVGFVCLGDLLYFRLDFSMGTSVKSQRASVAPSWGLLLEFSRPASAASAKAPSDLATVRVCDREGLGA
jgi:hypothetical protein